MKHSKNIINLIILIILIIICLLMYFYVKIESFYGSSSIVPTPITSQLTSEIARVIGVSQRRIINIVYNGDISKGILNVSFTILDPSFVETLNYEITGDQAKNISNDIFNKNNFNVMINNQPIKLIQILNNTIPTITNNFFNNTQLLTVAKYANNKYISVPNDESLTNFYNLDVNSDYNVSPRIRNIPTPTSTISI